MSVNIVFVYALCEINLCEYDKFPVVEFIIIYLFVRIFLMESIGLPLLFMILSVAWHNCNEMKWNILFM